MVIEDESLLPELRERLNGSNIGAAAGAAAVVEAAAMGADWVMSAIVGVGGPRAHAGRGPHRLDRSRWPTRKA